MCVLCALAMYGAVMEQGVQMDAPWQGLAKHAWGSAHAQVLLVVMSARGLCQSTRTVVCVGGMVRRACGPGDAWHLMAVRRMAITWPCGSRVALGCMQL